MILSSEMKIVKRGSDDDFKPIKCECGAVLMKSLIPNPPVEIKCRKCKRVVKLYEKEVDYEDSSKCACS
jgi:hypothetical protein